MRINVLLADGRKLLREGLSALLEKHSDIHVAGEAEDGDDCVRLVRPLGINVVVLNLAPPTRSSLQVVSAIAAAKKDVRIVVLVFSPSAHTVRELLRAGVSGCLARDCASAELVQAIRTVAAGGTYLSNSLVDMVAHAYAGHSKAGLSSKPLAPREQQILQGIAAGQSTKEIAAALKLRTKTIETHRRRLMEKLNLHTVAELTKYAVMQGLSPLEVSA